MAIPQLCICHSHVIYHELLLLVYELAAVIALTLLLDLCE